MRLLKLLLLTLISSFCLGQFGKLPLVGEVANLYILDVVAALLVIGWLVWKLGVVKRLPLPPLSGTTALFAAIALIALVNGKRWLGLGEWLVAVGYWVRWVVYAGVYFVVVDLLKREPQFRSRIINFLILAGIILAILGGIQLLVFPNLSELDPQLGWDPHQGRLVSTWLDPNFVGAFLAVSLALSLGRIFSYSKQGWRLVRSGFDFVALGSLGTALVFTFSRSAWALLAIILGVFGVLKSRGLLLMMALVFFGAYFLVPRVQTRLAGITDPADSASLRLVSWQRTLEIIKDHPVLGVGFNAFRYAQERAGFFRDSRGVPFESGHSGAGSDSSLLLVWATTGIFGLLSYFWLYGQLVLLGWRRFRDSIRPDAERLIGLAFLASLLGLLVESNFINSLFYPPLLLWVWIMAGVVVTAPAGVGNSDE